MYDKDELIAVLGQLASEAGGGDPTLAFIERLVPQIRGMDWINRFGPANAWADVVARFNTEQLERLTKCLVVLERDLEWLGGSVAAAIWLYRAHAERPGADPDSLADWVLRNRGRNEYLPFGRMTAARSLEGWGIEQRLRAERRRQKR